MDTPRFPSVSCSQCGREFGPGNHGFSHCGNHAPQCVNCLFAIPDENRADQVTCNNPDSLAFDGLTEATGTCPLFQLDTAN